MMKIGFCYCVRWPDKKTLSRSLFCFGIPPRHWFFLITKKHMFASNRLATAGYFGGEILTFSVVANSNMFFWSFNHEPWGRFPNVDENIFHGLKPPTRGGYFPLPRQATETLLQRTLTSLSQTQGCGPEGFLSRLWSFWGCIGGWWWLKWVPFVHFSSSWKGPRTSSIRNLYDIGWYGGVVGDDVFAVFAWMGSLLELPKYLRGCHDFAGW